MLALFIGFQVKLKIFFFLSQSFEFILEKLSENNPYLYVAIDDFNAKHRHWYSQDTNNSQGTSVENVASQFGLNLDYNK